MIPLRFARPCVAIASILACPTLALADNCGGLADCYGTALAAAKVAAAIAVAIGIWAVLPEILAAAGLAEVAEVGLTAGGLGEASEIGLAAGEGGEAAETILATEATESSEVATTVTSASEPGEIGEIGAQDAVTEGAPGTAQPSTGLYPDFNTMGGTQNCGSCADAVDNYLAGNGLKPAGTGGPAWPTTPGTGPWNWGTSPSSIESGIRAAGDGARGIAYVWDGAAAHVFNVVNQGGNIVAIDGQVGVFGSVTDVAANAGYGGTNITWAWLPTFP